MTPHHGLSRTDATQEGICGRCHGLMVPSFTDSLSVEMNRECSTQAWRCVNCGEWIDEMITANRKRIRHRGASSGGRVSAIRHRRWRW